MRGYLGGSSFVRTGSERWNALVVGSTAVHSLTIVYNTKRSGEVVLGGRRFLLRRVRLPKNPPAEWFAIDLLEHAGQADLEGGPRLGAPWRGQTRHAGSEAPRPTVDFYGSATQEHVRAALAGAA